MIIMAGMKQKFAARRRVATLATTALGAVALLVLAGCGGGGTAAADSASSAAAGAATLSAPAQVGALLFADAQLSASGQQSCASCHVAATGFAAADGRPVPLGGPQMNLPGLRNTPSLMYASFTPSFHLQTDGTPVGGFFRDGRAATLAAQARQPFLNPFEMANASPAELLGRLKQRPYFAQFTAVFGTGAASDPDAALTAVAAALAAYESEAPQFHPFSSKFDAFLQGQATLSTAEAQGYALFIDPSKGNCTACHVATATGGAHPLFTDFTYDNVGVPRNWAIEANAADSTLPYVPANGAALGAPNDRYYDLGLCGPTRTDLPVPSLCGFFKVPSLRNVALRQHYFHNGVFSTLNEVVSWYATRDTDPARWYLQADGLTPDLPYNDLPALYDANVNVTEVPYNPGIAPTLTPAQVNLVVSFLCTLTDGYDPAQPASYALPPQCLAAAAAAQ
jgi:cytochrome c peroxidase